MTLHLARHLTTLPDLAELNRPCEHAPVVIDRPVVLYGKGELGQMASDYLKAIGHPQVAWIDQFDISRAPMDALTLVAVARWPYVPIERALTAQGFKNVAPFLDVTPNYPQHPLANGWFADPLNLDKVYAVIEMFDDPVSRMRYMQWLAWKRLREEWVFEDAPVDVEGPRYWPPDVASVLHDHEVFVDGGAYHGGTIAEFQKQVGKWRDIWAIEPDEKNIDHLAASGFASGALVCALGESAVEGDVQRWAGGFGYASRLFSGGTDEVRVCALDEFNLSPTFIKLHLEGHELPALKGAAQTIAKNRPILAVTTYHSAEGISDIPLWMKDNCPDYRFLWRNSAWQGEGSVMFAIPKERG